MTRKCKYCGKEMTSREGWECSNCAKKRPVVQQLMCITAQMREFKRKREERRLLNR